MNKDDLLPNRERVIRLLKAMGYTQAQTRNIMYMKFENVGKLNMWVGERGALYTGKTWKKSTNITKTLPDLLKRFHI